MRGIGWNALVVLSLLAGSAAQQSHLGFDRNDYPGDNNLAELRKQFVYAGYWLNTPPGARTNTWVGKREMLRAAGFGFLVVFNGRLYSELKSVTNATKLGKSDAAIAIAAARHNGFPSGTIIFLDQEQGGRLLRAQRAYLFSWIDEVAKSGFRAGVYCSGIAAEEEKGVSIITAQDIRQHAGTRQISYWIANDACPPAPGCERPSTAIRPAESGIDFADVWQFAQSPKRSDVAAKCSGYSKDGNCYAGSRVYVDLNTATSADPSHGR